MQFIICRIVPCGTTTFFLFQWLVLVLVLVLLVAVVLIMAPRSSRLSRIISPVLCDLLLA